VRRFSFCPIFVPSLLYHQSRGNEVQIMRFVRNVGEMWKRVMNSKNSRAELTIFALLNINIDRGKTAFFTKSLSYKQTDFTAQALFLSKVYRLKLPVNRAHVIYLNLAILAILL